MYDIVRLNMEDCTFQVLYEFIPTEAETQLLAKLAMTDKENDEELILILPSTSVIDKNSNEYKVARMLGEKYKAAFLKRHAFSLAEYAQIRKRRKTNG